MINPKEILIGKESIKTCNWENTLDIMPRINIESMSTINIGVTNRNPRTNISPVIFRTNGIAFPEKSRFPGGKTL
jgi:hypothetical protein